MNAGDRCGMLTVIESNGIYQKNGCLLYKCKCDCGNETVVVGTSLRNGKTKSCGCLIRDTAAKRSFVHGYAGTRLYKSWWGMVARCTNEKSHAYGRYGGRGISVCDEWMDFDCFREWAVKNGYSDNLQIDRIDNDKGYEPSNCRWVDSRTNMNNRRTTLFVEYMGERLPLTVFVEKYANGLPERLVRDRIFRQGWSPSEAISVNVGMHRGWRTRKAQCG